MDNDQEPIRVRFAPSPTGHLHVGGARTALYNWLLARKSGGIFILRIEDTDISRSTEDNIRQIMESMLWLGLDWDEGPDREGKHGPYRQMQRLEIYRRAADELLGSDKAYRCFCSKEEIAAEREEARRASRAYVYSGRCANLKPEESAACEADGRGFVIRLRAPSGGTTVVNDLIRGEVSFDNALIGDIILVRASGIPTYNFAVAVDDSQMGITHVIRGDDHLPNTPKQLMVLEAMVKPAPAYAHLPLILGPDRTPLSKRHGASSVEEFRVRGYIPEALCNYLALLGWSYDAETTIFTTGELVEKFSLGRVGATAAVFDNDKLLWMNGYHIRNLEPEKLSLRLEEYIATTRLSGLPGTGGRPGIEELIPLAQEKMKTLADFVELTDFFFLPPTYEDKALAKLRKDELAPEILIRAAGILSGIEPYDAETIEEALRRAADEMDIRLGKLLQPVRIAVSGKLVTPGMFETLAVLGKEKGIDRINAAIKMARND
ncbi:MAG: glutamate--tRNA ligase [Thermoleophilia bacterium]|nr:glutamate--tRNA ligase [Thermoleophilia bacterium]